MFNKSKLVLVAALASVSASVMAAIDTTAAGPMGTALTAAQTSGEAAGGMVIAVVAGLVVVGVIIALVRKV